MAEIPFEYLLAALESTKGTAINPPTYYMNMAGTITPRVEVWRPDESRGILAEYTRQAITRQWSEWEAEGPADVLTLPVLLSMAVKGGVSATVPSAGVYLYTFAPTMTSDDLKSATMYWGDPNVQAFQADFCMCDEITLRADVGSTDGVMMSARGMGRPVAKTAPASLPTMSNAVLLAPTDQQLWIDTTTIGSTAVTGRLVSSEVTIASGVTYKWLAAGTSSGQEYQLSGRKKRHAEMRLVMELVDTTQYDQWAAATSLKVRLRYNGSVISSSYRYYINVDIYGPFESLEWGEYEGSNRTLALTIKSVYDTTATYDFAVAVENNKASI